MAIYLFTIQQDYHHSFDCLIGVSFSNEWVTITPDGMLTIRKGYSWDGCSPKFKIFGKIIGIPDGPMQPDGYAQTAWASLCHDALCQFKHDIPITKAQSLCVFDTMLRECGWWARKIYTFAVNHFGPQKFSKDS